MEATCETWTVDDLGVDHFRSTNHRYGIGCDSRPTYRIAKVEGDGPASLAIANRLSALPKLEQVCRMVRDDESLMAFAWDELRELIHAALEHQPCETEGETP